VWPENVNFVATVEEALRMAAADRGIVFLTVDWSVTERHSRQCFRRLVESLAGAAVPEIDLFVVNEDDDAVRQELPASVDCSCVPLGVGTMFWMERGKVVAGEINPCSIGHRGLFDRTIELWGSFETEGVPQ
jgi:hypothetical protein